MNPSQSYHVNDDGNFVIFGRYEIKELIDEGGFGSVYLAKDLAEEKELAIKIVKLKASDWSERELHVLNFVK